MNVSLKRNKQDWVASYLTIWQGFMGLTEREVEVLTLIALRYLELQESVTEPKLLAELLLSAGARVALRAQLGEEVPLSVNGLQNYLSSLQKKEALLPLEGRLILNPKLVPQKTITFNFTSSD